MSDFIFTLRVYAEDTDYGGIVYHANYIKYLERARTEWLRHLGHEQDQLLAKGYLFVVVALTIQYRQPARFNDILAVTTQMIQRGRASLVVKQHIEKQKNNQLLTTAKVKVACVNQQLKPCALPIFI